MVSSSIFAARCRRRSSSQAEKVFPLPAFTTRPSLETLQPRSWWYGVWQSFAASFFFVLAGYVLLRMTGSWEVLLGSLLNQ